MSCNYEKKLRRKLIEMLEPEKWEEFATSWQQERIDTAQQEQNQRLWAMVTAPIVAGAVVTAPDSAPLVPGVRLLGGLIRRAPKAVPEGYTRVYRAVSETEYKEILRTGRFNQGPNSLEGKWFADTLEGAKAFGKALYPNGKYRIIEADVPNNAKSLYRLPNLDGRGPARYLHLDDLQKIAPRPAGN